MNDVRNDPGGNHAGAACERLRLHAALVRAHTNRVAAEQLHPINVCAARREILVAPHLSSHRPDHFAVGVVGEENCVRNAGVNEVIFTRPALKLDRLPEPQVVRLTQRDRDSRP